MSVRAADQSVAVIELPHPQSHLSSLLFTSVNLSIMENCAFEMFEIELRN